MNYPLFIDIEASLPDEEGFPIAIAWSLPDGSVKSVMVCPDDDWEPWDNSEPDMDIQHLLDQGVSGPDIIREINMDLSGQTVFIDGLDDDEGLIEKLFDTYDEDPDFELASMSQLFTSEPFESLVDQIRQIQNSNQLDRNNAEDNVRAMLFLANESGIT